MESIKVIDKGCTFIKPLSVEFSPHSLGPAGIGDGEVQSIGIRCMPITGCMEVSQRILVVVGSNLGISTGSACEEHQQQVVTLWGILCSSEGRGESMILFVEVSPAIPFLSNNYFVDETWAGRGCFIDFIGTFTIACTYDGAYFGCVYPILDIMGQELV